MIYNVQDFPREIISGAAVQKKRRGNPAGQGHKHYLDLVTAFDIETTNVKDPACAFMYVWQYALGTDVVVMGRTWEEFKEFLGICMEVMPSGAVMVTYVHNLSFEFAFLSGVYPFHDEEVFAVAPRKVLKCTMFDRFEFRCSYLHSNMSLDAFTKKMGVQHSKLTGSLDYSVMRYPWTELTEEEKAYCVNDVQGLVEALTEEMRRDKDSLYTIPLTSTGYVRRDTKSALVGVNHLWLQSLAPTWHLYAMLREAFRGGNAHANRFYAGEILEKVTSADMSSCYPNVICNCQFPISTFYEAREKYDLDGVLDLIKRRKKALIMRVRLWGVDLRFDWWGCPYLAREKCRNVVDAVYDNGRILSAAYLETTITDVDLRILVAEYTFTSFDVVDLAMARYGKLPQNIIDLTIDYYKKKTELKGNKDPDAAYLYARSKEKLNSIYGMMAQDPVKENMLYADGAWEEADDDPRALLAKANRKCFLVYQWGVWTTAWARYRLEEGVALAGDNFVYCDTDSVKYMGNVDWADFNSRREQDSMSSGAHAMDAAGVEHYMGVFEPDGVYDRFCTLGAKKYVYEENGKLHCTIAGVNKKKGGEELEKHGGIEAFEPGFVFTEAGGTESVYNDDPEPITLHLPGGDVEIRRGVMIRESSYTLGITQEYEFLLHNPRLLRRFGFKD